MSQIATLYPDQPDLWDNPPSALADDAEWCRSCGYSIQVHWAGDDVCPDEATARQRWADR